MIFISPLFEKVLDGSKTQTRRPVKDGQRLIHIGINGNDKAVKREFNGSTVRTVWRWGETYAVQPGRGKPAQGRIRITLIRYIDKARHITMEDAVAEGFSTPEEFRQRWAEMYGEQALNEPCWALTFEPVGTT
jgi:hypothetical protein